MRNPERQFDPKIEPGDTKGERTEPIESDRKQLKAFLKTRTAELREHGLPYKENGEMRIDMYSRDNISKEKIIEDEEEAKKLRKEFHEKLVNKLMEKDKLIREEAEKKAKEIEIAGEDLEILKTVVFYKYLKEEFIIARSTNYDDIKRHVDNVILDKKTGNIVCALDETTDLDSVEDKKNIVNEINEENGASLKYGLALEEEIFKSPIGREIKNIVKVREVSNIPLFYLPIKYKWVKEVMAQFEADVAKVSDGEAKLYKAFVELIRDQIRRFPSTRSNQQARMKLNNFSRESFSKFDQAINKFSNK